MNKVISDARKCIESKPESHFESEMLLIHSNPNDISNSIFFMLRKSMLLVTN